MIPTAKRYWGPIVSILACSLPGIVACEDDLPIEIKGQMKLDRTPVSPFLLIFGKTHLSEDFAGKEMRLDWDIDTISIIDKQRHLVYRSDLLHYRADMLARRKVETEEILQRLGPAVFSLDSCTQTHLGPYRHKLTDDASSVPIAYPEKLNVSKQSGLSSGAPPSTGASAGTEEYLVRSTQGDSLARIWLRPGPGLAGIAHFGKMLDYYYRFYQATEPFYSFSAAGINILAHPDVVSLYLHGLPVKVVVTRPEPCRESDVFTFGKPIRGRRSASERIPRDYRPASLAEVMALR